VIVYTYSAKPVSLSAPVVLKSGAKRRGHGWGQTILYPRKQGWTGAVISSADLEAWKASGGKGRWTHEGVPVGLLLEELAIDGKCGVNPQPWLFDKERPHCLNGADIYSPGASLRRLAFHDLDGWGLIYNYGNSTLNGWHQVTDTEQPRIETIRTQRTLGGIWIAGGADMVMRDLEASTGLGVGFQFDCASSIIETIHAAGWLGGGKDSPDVGVGILNSLYKNHFTGVTQADHCRVGVRSYGAGTTIEHFLGKRCTEVALEAFATIKVVSLEIENMGSTREFEHFNDAPLGMVIGPKAQFSQVKSADISTGDATNATAIVCEASHTTLNVDDFWGGGHEGNTVVRYGSADHAPNGGRGTIHGNGCGHVLQLDNIGACNDHLVLHGSKVKEPVGFKEGVREKLAKGNNRLIARNVDTGECVCWNDFKNVLPREAA
jgi:hypothetical protein